MKKHTKIYLEHFGFDTETFIPCEVCGSKAVDIHHIHRRGMGGSKSADYIGNLMAVCRACHIKYGDLKQYKEFLIETHEKYMNENKQDQIKPEQPANNQRRQVQETGQVLNRISRNDVQASAGLRD